ncbi:MAG: polysaccharide export protein [Verrucomicrobia bacterium]|nr:polysaccharide export protein [Verrucomicrobiota bacterium]
MNQVYSPRFLVLALVQSIVSSGPALGAQPAEPGARVGRAEAPAAAPDREYLLQPQDLLRIFIFQHDDLNKQMEAVRISDAHTISLPLVNSVNLRGRTARQAEEVIRAAYDRDYLVNPQVSVIVVKYAERSVNVVGQVNNAGRVLFPQEKGLTIVEAIALAGGQTRLADLRKVRLTRKTADGETVVEEIDVDALMKRGGRDAIALQRDDVIFIPERAF